MLANIAYYLFRELLNFDVGSPSLAPSQKQVRPFTISLSYSEIYL